ncbi:transcriptional regulator [Fervidicella metallireducens AeB]|uniref:Transcriptional regulator n=1 Tax=Fervidicella metallireducens AeB TaxID=1403537 RepID=A0A017RYJ8_9CLOT|nr:LCP family protein [Fervidicella metallireducens]EYE89474.1 transcriptional regulator [Fervidicella metallireducens AeB]
MKKRTGILIFTIILSILLTGAYIGFSYFKRLPRKELPKSNEELGIVPEGKIDKEIYNIALFGLDARNPDVSSRSDSIIVASVNRKAKNIKITSFMRDLYIPIPGHGENRINAAYAIDGAKLAVKTINQNFNLDIRDYITVNFEGLEKLVDAIGGVEIYVKKAEIPVLNKYLSELNKLQGNTVADIKKEGLQILNGRQAVAYSRIRYVGNGDYERTERQRRVLNQIYIKIKAQGMSKLPETISKVFPYVETSLSNTQILTLVTDIMGFNLTELEEYRIPVDKTFTPKKIKGMAVLVPDIPKNKELLHKFIYEK